MRSQLRSPYCCRFNDKLFGILHYMIVEGQVVGAIKKGN